MFESEQREADLAYLEVMADVALYEAAKNHPEHESLLVELNINPPKGLATMLAPEGKLHYWVERSLISPNYTIINPFVRICKTKQCPEGLKIVRAIFEITEKGVKDWEFQRRLRGDGDEYEKYQYDNEFFYILSQD